MPLPKASEGDLSCTHKFPTDILTRSFQELEGIYCQLCKMSAIEAKCHHNNARYLAEPSYSDDDAEEV